MFKLVVLISAGALVPFSAPARGESVIKAGHQAPESAYAGDPLTLKADVQAVCGALANCSAVTLTAHYLSPLGEERTAVGRTSKPGTGQIEVTIPGDDVRYPAFSYWLEAKFTQNPGATGATEITQRLPAVETYSVPVETMLRFWLRNPDGTPAKDVKVMAFPTKDGDMWEAISDSTGLVRLPVPPNDSRILERAGSHKYANVLIWAFDRWPAALPAGSSSVNIAGNGVHLGALVNLGLGALEAVDRGLQDLTFTLSPEQIPFSNTTTADAECAVDYNWFTQAGTKTCRLGTYVGRTPLAKNIGGGAETATKFEFTSSTMSSTTFMVKRGLEWATSENEISATEESSSTGTSRVVGPNDNVTVMGDFNWVHEKITWYTGGVAGEYQQKRPETWTGMDDVNYPSTSHHDEATKMTMTLGSDCVQSLNTDEFKSSTGNSTKTTYSVDIGGTVKSLTARTKYVKENESGAQSLNIWKRLGTNFDYHHRFVPNGIVYASDIEGPGNKCPHDHPGLTWTDSSNEDKTLKARVSPGSGVPNRTCGVDGGRIVAPPPHDPYCIGSITH